MLIVVLSRLARAARRPRDELRAPASSLRFVRAPAGRRILNKLNPFSATRPSILPASGSGEAASGSADFARKIHRADRPTRATSRCQTATHPTLAHCGLGYIPASVTMSGQRRAFKLKLLLASKPPGRTSSGHCGSRNSFAHPLTCVPMQSIQSSCSSSWVSERSSEVSLSSQTRSTCKLVIRRWRGASVRPHPVASLILTELFTLHCRLNDVCSLIVALQALKLAETSASSSKFSYGWQRAEVLGGASIRICRAKDPLPLADTIPQQR